jgi:hypothetical protein
MVADDDYDELEIELRSVEGGFEARVLRSPFSRAAEPFVPPWRRRSYRRVIPRPNPSFG